MSKHTPGPWLRYTRKGQMGIVAGEVVEKECTTLGGTKTIESYEFDVVGGCSCCGSPYGVNDHDTAEANARLIAAAPDLLAALQSAIECGMVPKSSASDGGAVRHAQQVRVADKIRAAIDKAIGET